VIQSFTKQQEH